MVGYATWGPWGSTVVWDTCFIIQFARCGHHAHTFITALDNVYARQYENGFICRESDCDNREVYVMIPVNPPLLAWAEWQNYRISSDKERLYAASPPLVRYCEGWMTYQRRENGLYWPQGFDEADDSPRSSLMHATVSATSYHGLAAQCLAKIAMALGRDDMAAFFVPTVDRSTEPVRVQRRLQLGQWTVLARCRMATHAIHGTGKLAADGLS